VAAGNLHGGIRVSRFIVSHLIRQTDTPRSLNLVSAMIYI